MKKWMVDINHFQYKTRYEALSEPIVHENGLVEFMTNDGPNYSQFKQTKTIITHVSNCVITEYEVK